MHDAVQTMFRSLETPTDAVTATRHHQFINSSNVISYPSPLASVGSRGHHAKTFALAAIVFLLSFILAVSFCLLPRGRVSSQPLLRRLASSDGKSESTVDESEFSVLCGEFLEAWSPLQPEGGNTLPPFPSPSALVIGEGLPFPRKRNVSASQGEEAEGGVKRARQEPLWMEPTAGASYQATDALQAGASTSYHVPPTQEGQHFTRLQTIPPPTALSEGVSDTLGLASPSDDENNDEVFRWMDALLENFGSELEMLHSGPDKLDLTELASRASSDLLYLDETPSSSANVTPSQPPGKFSSGYQPNREASPSPQTTGEVLPSYRTPEEIGS
ncbi:uncharacterized protein EMH_0059690 [Eimeria mitis]|uniref:Transmembrane protein n=1 Tax=Eimeria mitis TaxID=44415 RepID=U6K7W1_9EIME|nr:uncharacterized protein EMH_0059690 [Eimeria mitis]CDJ34095.1 hypothetical protein, conserved [Eimeria mitis]